VNNIKYRNTEIIRLREQGITYQEIADSFDICRSRVGQIVNKYEVEERCRQQAEKYRELFKSADDIEKKFQKDVIIEGLLFERRAAISIKRYFDSQDISEISIKDVMNFLTSDFKKLPAEPWEAMPAYKQKHIGVKTYSSLVHHLSELDLGEAFNTEWQNRLEKLARYLITINWHIPSFLRRYLS